MIGDAAVVGGCGGCGAGGGAGGAGGVSEPLHSVWRSALQCGVDTVQYSTIQ